MRLYNKVLSFARAVGAPPQVAEDPLALRRRQHLPAPHHAASGIIRQRLHDRALIS
jgi:hypothetical protein